MKNSFIAIVGAGKMGSRIGKRLVDSGCSVDLITSRSGNLKESLQKADFVLSFLPTDEISRKVWNPNTGDEKNKADLESMLRYLQSSAVFCECGTLSPLRIKEIEKNVVELGLGFVECPVIGSTPQAEAGKLIGVVGGELETINKVKNILEVFCERVELAGAVGKAAELKLAANAYFATQFSVLSELLRGLELQGHTKAEVISFFKRLPVTSPGLQGVLSLVETGSNEIRFTIEMIEKDLRYANKTFQNSTESNSILSAVHELLQKTCHLGKGQKNFTAVFDT